jgi:tellurite resistance protein
MVTDDKINQMARVAKAGEEPRSILALAAAAYGARPVDESTVPTGFDPLAAALFESIVEGAFLVASADGVFDAQEREVFERVVTLSCGGTVPPKHVEMLVSDLSDQLAEDGLDRRISAIGETLQRHEQAVEVLRIAALIAHVSEDVSDVERAVLEKLASACNLGDGAVDSALDDVRAALAP